jgi:hypothetical protein
MQSKNAASMRPSSLSTMAWLRDWSLSCSVLRCRIEREFDPLAVRVVDATDAVDLARFNVGDG